MDVLALVTGNVVCSSTADRAIGSVLNKDKEKIVGGVHGTNSEVKHNEGDGTDSEVNQNEGMTISEFKRRIIEVESQIDKAVLNDQGLIVDKSKYMLVADPSAQARQTQ